MTTFDQIGVFPENATYLSLNCAFSKHIDYDWFHCKLHCKKVTGSECASCQDRQALDPSIPFDSLMSVDGRFGTSIGFTLSRTEREQRAKQPINVIDSGTSINTEQARQPEGRRLAQLTTFFDGLNIRLSQAFEKGDIFDDIKIEETSP